MTASTEEKVLDVYRELSKSDPEGAWNPYYADVARAANGDADLAYAACKKLKKDGLLECNGRQGGGLFNAPAYWPTEKAVAAA
jgi:hypothetical protein